MSNQPPSASTDGIHCPSPTSLSPEDPRTEMSGGEKVNKVIIICIFFFGILILVALATSSLLRDPTVSKMNACISNLKHLEGAREAAIMAGKTNPCMADLCGAAAYVKVTPVCPASRAVYTVPADPVAPFVCPNPGISGDPEWTHSLYR